MSDTISVGSISADVDLNTAGLDAKLQKLEAELRGVSKEIQDTRSAFIAAGSTIEAAEPPPPTATPNWESARGRPLDSHRWKRRPV